MRNRRSRSLDTLIQAGIAPRRARRILREFAEHHADVVVERMGLGESARDARIAAGALVEWRGAHGGALSTASPVIQWISANAGVYLLWALPCTVAARFAWAAARRRETSIWPCVGIAAVCFVGALTNFSVSLPPAAPSMGAGIGIGTDHLGATLLRAGSTTARVLLPFLRVRWLQRHELLH